MCVVLKCLVVVCVYRKIGGVGGRCGGGVGVGVVVDEMRG